MLFLHSDPISILSPGFCWASRPFLTETDASPVTWRFFHQQTHGQFPLFSVGFQPPLFGVENQMPPPPGLRQRHAWTFRNSRSAKPDLKLPGRIWHFMILDSCPSVQSQPFGDFRNHLFKQNIKMQIPPKFLGQNGNFSKFSGWFGEIGSHLGRCKFPCFHHFRWKNSPEPWKSEW